MNGIGSNISELYGNTSALSEGQINHSTEFNKIFENELK